MSKVEVLAELHVTTWFVSGLTMDLWMFMVDITVEDLWIFFKVDITIDYYS